MAQVFLLLLSTLLSCRASAQETDMISRGALIPWKRDVATPDRITSEFEEIHIINGQGNRLRGWYFSCAEATHTILVCSGNTGNISLSLPYAKLLLDGGFNVLLFDYQGFGGSEGIASVTSLCTDTEAAFQYLTREKRLKANEIGVFGISLGSILALMIANEQKAAAVAVEDVFIPEQILERFGVREDDPNAMKGMAIRVAKKLLLGRVDPLQNTKACECPVFLMHGLNDRLLPFYGTVQVADVLNSRGQVWLMDQAGHAPETLEVNDREYAAQLTRFFRASMTTQVSSLKLKLKSQQVGMSKAAGSRVGYQIFESSVTLVDLPDEHRERRPVQLVFVDRRARYRVVRTMMAIGETRLWRLPFEPVHCSATEFQYVTPRTIPAMKRALDVETDVVHEWDPELSDFSRHRASLVKWSRRVFKNPGVAHHLMSNYGLNYFRAPRYLKDYPDSDVQNLLSFLKSESGCPPEIYARYARLLARLYCWPLPKKTARAVQFSNDAKRVALVETMLTLLPQDKEDYFELGNASFQYQFRDAVISDAIFRLARLRLRDGRVDAARQLLRLHVLLLPAKIKTNLTEERIALISSPGDLDGSDESNTKHVR